MRAKGARNIDIDVLLFGDRVVNEPGLKIRILECISGALFSNRWPRSLPKRAILSSEKQCGNCWRNCRADKLCGGSEPPILSFDLPDADFLSVRSVVNVAGYMTVRITGKHGRPKVALDEESIGAQRQVLILVDADLGIVSDL